MSNSASAVESGIRGTGAASAFFFIFVAYALSWSVFAAATAAGQEMWIIAGIAGPSIAALALSLVLRGPRGLWQLLKRFGRMRAPWQVWAFLLFGFLAMNWIGQNLWYAWRGEELDIALSPLQYWPQTFLFSILVAGLGEEIGWRGYALPRLQNAYGVVVATLILAIAHLFWHLPTYWLGQGMHNVPLLWVAGFVIPFSFILTWLYNAGRGGLLFGILGHGFSNVALSLAYFMPSERDVPISPELITATWLPLEQGGAYLAVLAVWWLVMIVLFAKGAFSKAPDIPL